MAPPRLFWLLAAMLGASLLVLPLAALPPTAEAPGAATAGAPLSDAPPVVFIELPGGAKALTNGAARMVWAPADPTPGGTSALPQLIQHYELAPTGGGGYEGGALTSRAAPHSAFCREPR